MQRVSSQEGPSCRRRPFRLRSPCLSRLLRSLCASGQSAHIRARFSRHSAEEDHVACGPPWQTGTPAAVRVLFQLRLGRREPHDRRRPVYDGTHS